MMKRSDIKLITVLLAVAIVVFLGYRFFNQEEGSRVIITVNQKEFAIHSLNETITIEIQGTRGINYLQIKDGYAKMVEADCSDQICVRHSAIKNSGESIICLPNKLIVEIQGSEKTNMDAVVE